MAKAFLTGQGVRYELSPGLHFIGRDPSCDVIIDDDEVSRRHALILASETRFFLVDFKSSNGIHFGKKQLVSEIVLFGGETFRVGSTTLRFERDKPKEPLLAGPPSPIPFDLSPRELSAPPARGWGEGRERFPHQIALLHTAADGKAVRGRILDGALLLAGAMRGLLLWNEGEPPGDIEQACRSQGYPSDDHVGLARGRIEAAGVLAGGDPSSFRCYHGVGGVPSAPGGGSVAGRPSPMPKAPSWVVGDIDDFAGLCVPLAIGDDPPMAALYLEDPKDRSDFDGPILADMVLWARHGAIALARGGRARGSFPTQRYPR